jgi:hypothetical protein
MAFFYLFLLQLQQKSMVFFAYSFPATAKAWSSLLILVPATAKKHGPLCFFAYSCSNFSKKAWSSLLTLVPASAKNNVFFACSTAAVKHVILGLFLFQRQQKAWSSLLILIPATAKTCSALLV